MAELENDLRFANRKTVLILYAASQDERVVIETEVFGIEKN